MHLTWFDIQVNWQGSIVLLRGIIVRLKNWQAYIFLLRAKQTKPGHSRTLKLLYSLVIADSDGESLMQTICSIQAYNLLSVPVHVHVRV